MSAYNRWSLADDISLLLQLVDPDGTGHTGGSPEVAIRRIRETHGVALDGYYWDGVSAFGSSPDWLPMVEFDATNNPGLYTYLFEQTAIGNEWVYYAYYRNTSAPEGFSVEEHVCTNEIYIPEDSPVVVIPPSDTVMAKLTLMEDPTEAVAQANADAVWDELTSGHTDVGSFGEAMQLMKDIEEGKQEIVDTGGGLLICYKPDNSTEVARFELYDANNIRTTGLHEYGDAARAVAWRKWIASP